MDDQMILALVVGGATLLVTLVLGFAFVGGDNTAKSAKRRLAEVGHGHGPVEPKPQSRHSARRQDDASSIKLVDSLVRKLIPKPAELRSRLNKTGMKISIGGEYFLMCLVMMALAWVVMRFTFNFGWFLTIPAGLTAGLMLPHWTIGFLGKRRVNKFMKHFPEAIELLVRGLRCRPSH